MRGTLSDIAPDLRMTILDIFEDLKKPENKADMKARRDALSLVSQVMERFGIANIDTSKAEVLQELDTQEAVMEGMAICEELYGSAPIVQKFIRACTTVSAYRGSHLKIDSAGPLTPALPDHPGHGPDPALLPFRVRKTPVDVQQEILGHDRIESPVENDVDVLRPSQLRHGAAPQPEGENPPERPSLDLSGEERQGRPSD
jgi:hypothetical protein